jgi:hypothetical protein
MLHVMTGEQVKGAIYEDLGGPVKRGSGDDMGKPRADRIQSNFLKGELSDTMRSETDGYGGTSSPRKPQTLTVGICWNASPFERTSWGWGGCYYNHHFDILRHFIDNLFT